MKVTSDFILYILLVLLGLYVLGPACGVMIHAGDYSKPPIYYAALGNIIGAVFTGVLACMVGCLQWCCAECLQETIKDLPAIEQGLSINKMDEDNTEVNSVKKVKKTKKELPTDELVLSVYGERGVLRGYILSPVAILLFGPITTYVISILYNNLAAYEYVFYGNLLGWVTAGAFIVSISVAGFTAYGLFACIVSTCILSYNIWLKCFEFTVLNCYCARRALIRSAQ